MSCAITSEHPSKYGGILRNMGSKAELSCVYSALISADDDVAITGEKIQTILKAASVDVDLIKNVGSGVGGSGPTPGGGN